MAEHSIDLALQGGGSHGAFTWGVLDRLLADPDVRIGGLSGTSAGAMNAVVLASGFGCWRPTRRAGSIDRFLGSDQPSRFTQPVAANTIGRTV